MATYTIEEIREALSRITPGPWRMVPAKHDTFGKYSFRMGEGDSLRSACYVDFADADAAFIAKAPEIAKFAVEMAEDSARVRKMFDTTRWQITDALGVDRSQSWFSVRSLVTELREENEKLRAEVERLTWFENNFAFAGSPKTDRCLYCNAHVDDSHLESCEYESHL